MAQEKGNELNPQPEVSLGWGSPRERTQETVLRAMLPDIDKNATMEDAKKLIAEEQKFGKKMVVDPRLDYVLANPPDEESLKALKENHGLRYIFEKSDSNALEAGDKISSSYMRAAANIAEIINRYIKIGGNFNRIASKDSEKFSDLNNQLERYLGISQGTIESFVAKLLEMTQGIEKRNKFLEEIGNGFGETKGIHIEILNNGGEQKISISYELNGKKEHIAIDKDILKRIIAERDEFEKKVDEKSRR